MADYSRTTQEDLEFALGNLCDMMSTADIMEKAKGNIGLTVTSLVCDAGGSTLLSSFPSSSLGMHMKAN